MNFFLPFQPTCPNTTLTTVPPTCLLLAHSAPATLGSLLFLQQVKGICSSKSFQLVLSLTETLFVLLTLSPTSDVCSNVNEAFYDHFT